MNRGKLATRLLVCCGILMLAWLLLAAPAAFAQVAAKPAGEAPPPQTAAQAESKAQILAPISEKQAYVPPQGVTAASVIAESGFDEATLKKLQEPITLENVSAELETSVRQIAALADLNIVLNQSEFKGKQVTFNFKEVPAMTALDSILKSNGLTLVREVGGVLRVVPISQVRGKEEVELRTRTIQLNWKRAEDVAKILEPLLEKKDGRITASQETNTLIISATPQKLDELTDIVAKLDVPEKQVLIEARLCEVSVQAQRSMGIKWDLATLDDNQLQIPVTFPDPTNAAGTIASNANMGNTLAAPAGFQGGNRNMSFIPSIGDAITKPVHFDSLEMSAPGSDNPVALWSFNRKVKIAGQDFNLSVALDLLEQRKLAKTLANPQVISLNNVEASIEIIRRIPYLDTQIGSGGAQTVTFQYEDVGVLLKVLPNVTANGFVRMRIAPEQKIFISQDGTNRPTIDLRKSATNVIVKDEDTALILGLRQQEFGEVLNAVPWIHRVPVIGWLFKGKNNSDRKNDLIAFVTPHIVKEPGITQEQIMRYNEIDERWNLPDYFFDDVKWEDTEK